MECYHWVLSTIGRENVEKWMDMKRKGNSWVVKGIRKGCKVGARYLPLSESQSDQYNNSGAIFIVCRRNQYDRKRREGLFLTSVVPNSERNYLYSGGGGAQRWTYLASMETATLLDGATITVPVTCRNKIGCPKIALGFMLRGTWACFKLGLRNRYTNTISCTFGSSVVVSFRRFKIQRINPV